VDTISSKQKKKKERIGSKGACQAENAKIGDKQV